MTNTTKTTTAIAKVIRKLTIEITDEALLAEAYPELMIERQVIERRPDREKLYPLVKAMHTLGRDVPGVRAYYSADETAHAAPETGPGASEGIQEEGEALETVSGRSKARGAA